MHKSLIAVELYDLIFTNKDVVEPRPNPGNVRPPDDLVPRLRFTYQQSVRIAQLPTGQ